MSKTLLNCVNDVLKRLGHIKGNSGELTSLTDSQRQVVIDLTVQSWNEAIIDLVDSVGDAVPKAVGSSTVTLATNTRDYAFATDFVKIRWPLQDTTNGRYIDEYPGGYEQLLRDQPIPGNIKGLPTMAAIRPTDGHLYVDATPQSTENGLVYTYLYDKVMILTLYTDTFPFSDEVYQMMIPAVAELVKWDREKELNSPLYKLRMAQAAGLVSENEVSHQWGPDRGSSMNSSDPLNE